VESSGVTRVRRAHGCRWARLLTHGLCIAATTQGLLLRSVVMLRMAPPVFAGISMAATAVLLLGWRALAAAKLPPVAAGGGGSKGGSNRKGGPLEFLQLLFGLTTRW
jgi:hypothetical protein